eukprot:g3680.t1
MGILEGTTAREGESKNYKRPDGHSSGAPCQDHYLFERFKECFKISFLLECFKAAQDVTVVATLLLLAGAGAGLLKQSSGCRRRKVHEEEPMNWPKTARFQRAFSETDVVDDAQTCWKFDYGKYKYTGLRPCATI